MVAIIDYDAGNLRSVEKAVAFLGGRAQVTRDAAAILSSDKVILPGVGAFGDAMSRLGQYGLDEVIRRVAAEGIPLLGICLGLQLLFERSEESKGVEGLGILKGEILKIPAYGGRKVPHMGWNSLEIRPGTRLFEGIKNQAYTYFVHSYYLRADDESVVAASTEYGVHIHAAVENGSVFACQFHPEKSGETGLRILDNFIHL